MRLPCFVQLCVRPNFGGTWVEQNGTMAQRVLPKWGRVMWFTTIIICTLLPAATARRLQQPHVDLAWA